MGTGSRACGGAVLVVGRAGRQASTSFARPWLRGWRQGRLGRWRRRCLGRRLRRPRPPRGRWGAAFAWTQSPRSRLDRGWRRGRRRLQPARLPRLDRPLPGAVGRAARRGLLRAGSNRGSPWGAHLDCFAVSGQRREGARRPCDAHEAAAALCANAGERVTARAPLGHGRWRRHHWPWLGEGLLWARLGGGCARLFGAVSGPGLHKS